jgi:parallel beta-helix repeat protein
MKVRHFLKRCSFLLAMLLSGWKAQAADIYVNPDGTCAGKAPCFTSITAAIQAAAPGDKIYIQPGVYQEDIVINRSLQLIGASAATTIIKPASSNIGSANGSGSETATSTTVIKVLASDVVISGLTIDGSNDNIKGVERMVNGVSIDARNGITNYVTGNENFDNLLLEQLVIKNIYGRGVALSTSNIRGNNYIRNCTFDNIEGNYYSIGLFSYWSAVHVTDCSFNKAYVSVNQAIAFTFQNNTCINSFGGVTVSNASNVYIENNRIDCRVEGSYGIYIFQSGGAIIKNNQVHNSTYGIVLEGSYSAATVTLTDNIIDGAVEGYTDPSRKTGVYATTEVSYYDPGQTLNVHFEKGNQIRNVARGIVVQASNAIREYIEGPVTAAGPDADYTINTKINDLIFANVSDSYIQMVKEGPRSHVTSITPTNTKFDSYDTSVIADGFALEDKIIHYMDQPELAGSSTEGVVHFITNQLFVTGNGHNTVAQRGVDFAGPGWTVHLKGDRTYAETVRINKSITLNNTGNAILQGLALVSNATVSLGNSLAIANELTLTKGIIATGSHVLTLLPIATVNGASDVAHVNGKVAKQGNTPFTFPIGNGTLYRPLTITAPALPTDTYQARYVGASAQALTPTTILNAGTPPLTRISDKEYWQLQQTSGVSTIEAAINWRDEAISGDKGDNTLLTLAQHSPTGWNNLGSVAKEANGLLWISAPITNPSGILALGMVTPVIIRPFAFESFTASRDVGTVELRWTTINDEADTHFEIYRSYDGLQFSPINSLRSNGNSSNAEQYSFTDAQPQNEKVYYFIKWSNSQRTVYTDTIEVQPNPITTIKIYYSKRRQALIAELPQYWKDGKLLVFAANGSYINQQLIQQEKHSITTAGWPIGIYIVRLVNAKGDSSESFKLLVH